MRHIDDGYSYEFYEYTQDVLDYYLKKSDYDSYADEDRYRESRLMLLDRGADEDIYPDGEYEGDGEYGSFCFENENGDDIKGMYQRGEGYISGVSDTDRSVEQDGFEGDITFSCGIF